MAVKLPPARAVLDLLPEAVCMVDPQGHFLYVNAAFEQIFGYPADEVLGLPMLSLVHPEDRAATVQAAERVMQGQPLPHFRNRYLHRDGHVVDIQWSARWLPDYGLRLAVGHEVTALRAAERALEHLANHDPLTGLANRARLWDALEEFIVRAQTTRDQAAVLYLDLDGFKHINDSHGHAMGDRVLREIGLRLRQLMPTGALAARVGGDEFAVLLPLGPGIEQGDDVAVRLREAVMQIETPHPLDVSIGLARYPEDGTSADLLLNQADAAMYVQKIARRTRPAVVVDFAG